MSENNADIVYDAIVIGLGGVGSSHGHTRLFRHAYFEHPNYVPLCLKSTKMFQELSDWRLNVNINSNSRADRQKHGQQDLIPLLEYCGVLVISDGGKDGQTYDVIDRCANSATKFDIPIKIMNTNELQNEYGDSFSFPTTTANPKMKGLLEPDAGFVRSELAIEYAIYDALYDHDHPENNNNNNNNKSNKSKTDIIENVEVTNISLLDNNSEDDNNNSTTQEIYLVETSDGCTYKTKGVIVTAGAWTSKLIPELNPYLKVTRQIQAWFTMPTVDSDDNNTNNDDSNNTSQRCFPSVGWFLDRDKDKLPIYGIPPDPLILSNNDILSKIALHGRDVLISPDDERTKVTKEEIQEICYTIQDWIPHAANPKNIIESKACLYTMTPDGHFILDNVSNIRNVLKKKKKTTKTGKARTTSSSRSSSSSSSNDVNKLDNDETSSSSSSSSSPPSAYSDKYSNIWCVAGLSGHGFKMTPALGEAIADLVMTVGEEEERGEGTTDLPIDFLRISMDRF
ncbi:DAO-domain-containing protein [Fragilariopsis cylindrus CCMP1102]|uniref:DAO-domain-containing protein n=1 Tax=Fragilariopsis cylindrus CCMP1102 TaxID=635003 RepID=A0A1E7EYI8_9STRA|nr:DAO-domain-containing protein [Fragilariopsis cylindrus CCMP1102]|eukprot:OEU10896.1 DAO-domain-containing protein [Fragilariopsis cylindrus CCMP1102]